MKIHEWKYYFKEPIDPLEKNETFIISVLTLLNYSKYKLLDANINVSCSESFK